MEKIIAGCCDCPFCQGEVIFTCCHPADVQELFLDTDDQNQTITAETCPLKTEPLTITLNPSIKIS